MKQSDLSRSERRSMIVLQVCLLLMVVAGIIAFAWRHAVTDTEQGKVKNSRVEYVNSRDAEQYGTTDRPVADAVPIEQAESFPFDPNTADSTQLLRLGLSPFQVGNIYKYRASGGVYHRPEQFKKLYGLTVAQWHHLEPLIRIGSEYQYLADSPEAYRAVPNNQRSSSSYSGARQLSSSYSDQRPSSSYSGRQLSPSYSGARRDTSLYPVKLTPGQFVDLNHADTTALKRSPGIGSYYARRIVEYRQKLGGFHALEQLSDIENLPLGIESYLRLEQPTVQRIAINRSTFRQLNNHPYISYYQARAITTHLRQFGPIHSFQDISLYEEFSDQDFQRLAPYIDFSEK